MELVSKKDFQYAKLYDPATGSFCTDGSVPGLVMGTETARRFEQNDGDVAVTVCCITYNHENFIRQTLDGFLMQKTNFRFKVFVGEDHGPDGTAAIVREYAEKYPDIIVPFIREQNMGAQRNLIDLCNHADSPYIAFCEGDDYWIDEYKLQKQFDYMQEHTDIRMCYTHTEIIAPPDWHLTSYFKHDKDGRMIIPRCTPDFRMKKYFTARDFIVVFPNHTSSAFYRWNYDLDIPEWYFHGLLGDVPITILQMGMGKAVYLPDITSAYRRSDVGVFMSKSDQEHFANTRLDYLRLLSGLREYFNSHFGDYLDGIYRYRITKEVSNYLTAAKEYQSAEMMHRLVDEYPAETFQALHTFLGSFGIYSALQRRLSNKDLYHLFHTRTAFLFTLPGLKVYTALSAPFAATRKITEKAKKALAIRRGYWKYTKAPKEQDLWVFSGFRHDNYMDNTMYFYEYILANHPEIRAVWLTTNRTIYEQLKAEGKPVYLMDTPKGTEIAARAAIAVTDHFAVTDFSPIYGFNDKTKVVQLWHGVGFKSMGNADGVKNTAERGVRYSRDILAMPGDGAVKRLVKRIKYRIAAPFREKFEKYFLFVCPGQERLDMIADVWHIPHENCLMAGHPRNLPVYGAVRQEAPVKVMYAPTYRFDYAHEQAMVDEFLNAAPLIQAQMEKQNGEFYLRMHPHTWRSYSGRITRALEPYDRIFLDETPDVYQEIGTFSVMISDYSSIALDFAMLDRPVVFHCADYDWFIENEAGFNLDFPNVIPGRMTRNWEQTVEEVCDCIQNPAKGHDLREEKIKYFFDKSVNGPDNSERIVAEIKKRIGLE